jgi:hypothetical protein
MRASFYISVLLYLFVLNASAQDNETRLKNGEDLKFVYKNESSFGLFASSRGLGMAYRRGHYRNVQRTSMFELEMQTFKHPKEIRTINPYYENSRGYYYGKLNSFIFLRCGFGAQNILFEKVKKNNVEIRYTYFFGPNVAFAKPVYLDVIVPTTTPGVSAVATEKYNPEQHFPYNIYGRAPYVKGIGETKIIPGGYAKISVSFEYAKKYNLIRALETGAVVDVFAKALPMMAYNQNHQVFISLYLKMIWGKKWF